MDLFARLETALARLEQQRAAARQAAAASTQAQAATNERLARLESAASDALRALDAMIEQK